MRIKKNDTSATIIDHILKQNNLKIFRMNTHAGVDVDDYDLDDGLIDKEIIMDNKKENEKKDSAKGDLSTIKKGADDIVEKLLDACTTNTDTCRTKKN